MKRMVLIHPYPDKHFGEENISVIVQMPLNLGYIAAMTPREQWEITFIDETREPALDDDGNLTFGHADLVGLTGLTYQAPRAYQIAAACRKAGIKTMAGGCHATIAPREVAQHVDAVLVGEAEVIYPQLLEDFARGQLKPMYDGGPTPLHKLKGLFPDREWLREKYNYRYSSIVTTRGCPFKCDFCSVPTIQGRKYRERPPEDVWDELQATSFKGLMLAEDNFYGYTPAAQERCHRLFKGWAERGLGKDWFGFTSLNVTQDRQVLDYMARSGCLGFLMGIESLDYDALKQMHKSVNIGVAKKNNTSIKEAYRSSFRNVHDHGMIVWGSVIFGTDFDTPDTFKQIATPPGRRKSTCARSASTRRCRTRSCSTALARGPHLPHQLSRRLVLLQLRSSGVPAEDADAGPVHRGAHPRLREPLLAAGAARALQADVCGEREHEERDVRVPRGPRLARRLPGEPARAPRPARFGMLPAPDPARPRRRPRGARAAAGGEGPGHARGPAGLTGAIGGRDAVPGGSRDRAGAARFGGGLGRERLHRRHRRRSRHPARAGRADDVASSAGGRRRDGARDQVPGRRVPASSGRARCPRGAAGLVETIARRAVAEATDAAGLAAPPGRRGVVFGTLGSADLGRYERQVRDTGDERVDSATARGLMPSTVAAELAVAVGCEGPVTTVLTACASGNHAIAIARRWLARGRADQVVVAAADILSQTQYTHFHNLRALAPDACRRSIAAAAASSSERGGRDGSRTRGPRASPGRVHPGAHPGNGGVGRRLPHDGPRPGRRGRAACDRSGTDRRRHRANPGGLGVRARDGHAAQRPGRGARAARSLRPACAGERHQVDDRTLHGRREPDRGRHLRPGGA